MKKIIGKAREVVSTVSDKVSTQIGEGISLVTKTVGGLQVLVSTERSGSYETEYDEKHYFVIPYSLSDTGFALHTMRCLPESALEINDLPKRRVFHFPNEYYESALKEYLVRAAQDMAIESTAADKHTLESLADDIDALDSKLTYGMLVVGGLAAIFNPIVGAGIAAKAVTPGAVGLVTKYGLRPLGEKMTQSSAEKSIKEAEQNVLKQFTESTTLRVTNPILQELELALTTNQDQHDPLVDPNLSSGSIPELDSERWRELTETAMWHVYRDVYQDSSKHEQANLGPEDLRWLDILFQRYAS